MYLLGIDLGSSAIKIALLDAQSQETIQVVSCPSTEMPIMASQLGWASQDPALWWSNTQLACRQLLSESGINPSEIIGIGIAYQMHGLVIVDHDKKVLRPAIIWCDGRAVEIGAAAYRALGEERCLRQYLNSPGNFTASKLKWVKENEPDIYRQIYKAMLPGDYLAMKMTDKIQTTISGLSEGVLWDFEKNEIANDLLRHFGFARTLLPDVVDTFSIQGRLTESAANHLGLSVDTPIAYRAGDQANNAFSLGVIHPHQVAATGGTSGVVYGIVNEAKYDDRTRVNAFAHVNHSHADPRIGILLCINGAGRQYAWSKNNIAPADTDYADMETQMSNIPVGADGLRILPFGNGAERMLGHKYLGTQMFNLQLNLHTRAHFYRATLEGIAFAFVYGIEIMQSLGIKPRLMRVGNDNLFQSAIFAQTVATLTDINIEMIETTGAIGAAKAAGIGVGHYPTLEAAIGKLKVIKSYHKQETNERYIQAYQDWKSILVKQYNIDK